MKKILATLSTWPLFTANRFMAYVVIFLSTVFTVIMQGNFTGVLYQNLIVGGDNVQYLAMSMKTFAPVYNPFALRFLSPFLAHRIIMATNWGPDVAWMYVTVIAGFFTLIYVYKILADHAKLSTFVSLVFTLVAAYTYFFTQYNFHNFLLVDPIANLAMAAGIYYALQQKWWPFLITMLIGMMNKETVLFVTPAYLLVAWARSGMWRSKQVLWGAGAVVLSAIGYLIFRHWMISHIHYPSGYSFGAGPKGLTAAENMVFALGENKDIFVIYHVFDFFWVIAIWAMYKEWQTKKLRSEYLLLWFLLIGALTIGRIFATDAHRVFGTMAPLLVLVSAMAFKETKDDRSRLMLLAILLAYIAGQLNWIISEGYWFAQFAVIMYFAYTNTEGLKKV